MEHQNTKISIELFFVDKCNRHTSNDTDPHKKNTQHLTCSAAITARYHVVLRSAEGQRYFCGGDFMIAPHILTNTQCLAEAKEHKSTLSQSNPWQTLFHILIKQLFIDIQSVQTLVSPDKSGDSFTTE